MYENYSLLEMDFVTPIPSTIWEGKDNYRLKNQIYASIEALTKATENRGSGFNYNEFDDYHHWGYNYKLDNWVCYDYA